jgi:pimeloyl-ACP methyl ester carboxylesterase
MVDTQILSQHQLLSFNLPGHGGGPYAAKEDSYSLRGMAESLEGFLQRHASRECVVVGWSLGGHIAMEVASRTEHLRGLVLIAAPPTGFPLSGFRKMPRAATTPHPSASEVHEHITGLCTSHEGAALFASDFAASDTRMRPALAQSIASGEFSDETELIKGDLPILTIVGQDDPFIDIHYLESLPWGNLWQGEVQIVSDAKHAPHVDAPAATALLISRFIESLAPSSAK